MQKSILAVEIDKKEQVYERNTQGYKNLELDKRFVCVCAYITYDCA